MITEIAEFRIADAADFEAAMQELRGVISASPGYIRHDIKRSIETPSRYVLTVEWETLEAHTEGFRGSSRFEQWKARLGVHRDGAVVEHFTTVLEHGGT